MGKVRNYLSVLKLTAIAAVIVLLIAFGGNKVYTVCSENAPLNYRKTVVIDAGHGGIDGGASSVNGLLESQINLEISYRLRDLMHLLGIKTKMIRTTDRSMHTSGNTIAAQKVSDLRERVRIVNETENCILVSIHQNYFQDSACEGPQVFYNNVDDSKALALQLQQQLINTLTPKSTRKIKSSSGIFLMENVNTCAVLIECGFLSNSREAALLCNESYQKKLCSVIASGINIYLTNIDLALDYTT